MTSRETVSVEPGNGKNKTWKVDGLRVTVVERAPGGENNMYVYINGPGGSIRHQDGRYAVRATRSVRPMSRLNPANIDRLRG